MQFKKLVQAYSDELKWRDENYVPKTLNEHLQVSSVSIGTSVVACAIFVGMDDTTVGTLNWVSSDQKLLKSFAIYTRFTNDMASAKVFMYTWRCDQLPMISLHTCILAK